MRTTNLIIAIATFEQMCVRRVSECWYMCKWRQYVYSYVIVYINIILDWPKISSFHLSLSLSLSLSRARALGLSLCISLPALYASILTTFLRVLFASYERCELVLCRCLRSSGIFFIHHEKIASSELISWSSSSRISMEARWFIHWSVNSCTSNIGSSFRFALHIRLNGLLNEHQTSDPGWLIDKSPSNESVHLKVRSLYFFSLSNNYMHRDTRVFNEMKTRATTMCTIARSWCLSWTPVEDLSDERKETNRRSKMKKHTKQRDNHTWE